ncbi:hypothetical protein SUGI_0576910 [Cryptomeria japonica]|nr:hypothetical protein SUGI_0576910 [Cryptomeria japonica]
MKAFPLFRVICVLVAMCFELVVQEETVNANIGVILDSTSWSGKIAKAAINLTIEDVNNRSQQLNGTKMFLHLQEAKTPIETLSAAIDLLSKEVVALIQTQTSEAAPFVSDLGEAASVPILSLSLSSPALSKKRFPFSVRMAHGDHIQMKSVAALVKHYGWRSIAFLHSNLDFGSGAMSALRDAL